MMRWLNGVLSAVKRMVNGRTQASMGQTPQAQPGANNTSVPTRGGKAKSQAAPTTKRQPAQSKPKRKPKAALPTTAAKSRKPKQKAALKASGANGKQPATRASKTRQHAK